MRALADSAVFTQRGQAWIWTTKGTILGDAVPWPLLGRGMGAEDRSLCEIQPAVSSAIFNKCTHRMRHTKVRHEHWGGGRSQNPPPSAPSGKANSRWGWPKLGYDCPLGTTGAEEKIMGWPQPRKTFPTSFLTPPFRNPILDQGGCQK